MTVNFTVGAYHNIRNSFAFLQEALSLVVEQAFLMRSGFVTEVVKKLQMILTGEEFHEIQSVFC